VALETGAGLLDAGYNCTTGRTREGVGVVTDGQAAAQDPGGRPVGALVGREAEMAELRSALDQALGGQGRLLLLSGEPGIGKSRLADELGRAARARGATVLWGRCWEAGGARAYWPWVQSIRAYARDQDEATLREQLGPGAAEVAQIVPELAEVIPSLAASPTGEHPDAARFRLFDAVAGFHVRAGRAQPIVLLLDDLQAADVPSLLLLQFLVNELAHTAMLVIGTYRDVDIDRDHPLTAALAELMRYPTTRRLHLRGLALAEVPGYVEAVTGTRPSPSVAAAIHRETEGNPLFLGEVARLAAAEGRLDDADPTYWERAIPQGVRETIGLRINRLSKECGRALSIASVLGRDFALEPLEQLSALTREELAEVLDEAAAARVVAEVPGNPGRLQFAHVLIRDTLYDELPPSHRARLHARAGEALERLYGADVDRHLAELAHHFCVAGLDGHDTRPVECSRRAGDHALAQLAYEEAVRLYRMALQALDRGEAPDEHTRLELLLSLGDAEMRAGDSDAGKRSFGTAADVARRLGSSEQLARAAIGYGGRFVWGRAGTDRNLVPLLEDALSRLDEVAGPLRVRLLARLAGALRDQVERAPREALSAEAVEIARSLADPATLAYALDGRYSAIWGPDTVQERLAVADEIIALAEEIGDDERCFQGRHYRLQVLMETGDLGGAREELEANSRAAEALHQPAQHWYMASMRALLALLEGRYGDAERLIQVAYAQGEAAETFHAKGTVRLQQYALRREQGRAGEVRALVREIADEYWFWPWAKVAAVHLDAEVGRRNDVRSAFEAFAADGFDDWPVDNDWLFGMTLLADLCTYLGDGERAGRLYELLSRYEDRHAIGHPISSTGSVARSLGNLAATAGRHEDAQRHFATALAHNGRMGARPWVAHTHHDLAAALLARDAPGDRARAGDELRRAAEIAAELGQVGLQQKLAGLLGHLGHLGVDPGARAPERAVPVERRPGSGAPNVFRREGDYWLVSFGGRELRLQHAKGLGYLATLLEHPGTEIHALDLVAPAAAPGPGGPAREDGLAPDQGDLGAVLDQQARDAYRRRVEELQADIEEAESWNDLERAARAQEELGFLLDELAAATGLGGRDRRMGSDAERARVNVTRAIRSSMARLGEHDPELGRHLEQTVRTGTFCVYALDPRAGVVWAR
jgi:tetratricopeptide (TPR) repeat protein